MYPTIAEGDINDDCFGDYYVKTLISAGDGCKPDGGHCSWGGEILNFCSESFFMVVFDLSCLAKFSVSPLSTSKSFHHCTLESNEQPNLRHHHHHHDPPRWWRVRASWWTTCPTTSSWTSGPTWPTRSSPGIWTRSSREPQIQVVYHFCTQSEHHQ